MASQILNIERIILDLLKDKSEITVVEVAAHMGLSKTDAANRKAIQRAFNKLIESNLLMAKGQARARVYLFKEQVPAFKDIPLSDESQKLLHYISAPVQARMPVGYHQEFLEAYEPNITTYLPKADTDKLLALGKVENAFHPAGTYARHILNRLLIDLSWNSSRLEGNTYSLLETKRLIELGESTSGKDPAETQMILNHKNTIEYIVESAEEEKISAFEIYSIHALLSENLLGDPSACGRIRTIAVNIGGSPYLPLDNPHLLKDCFERFVEKLNQIQNPFEQSFFSIVHLSYLQTFEDVNKRTARLVANIPLIKKNLRPLAFTDVEQAAYVAAILGVYEKNDVSLLRDLYVWAYERSVQRYAAVQQSMGKSNLFKMKYRNIMNDIIRTLILEKTPKNKLVQTIRKLIKEQHLSEADASQLFHEVEVEILSLHETNITRYRIRPSEFQEWKKIQESPNSG
jgi:Fic family protein